MLGDASGITVWRFRERPGRAGFGPYPVHMDKLPPPPPPPPPGRGRQQGSQPEPPSERRANKPDGGGGPNFNENGNGRPSGGALRRWLPWVIAGAFIAVCFVPALMKGGDGDQMTYSDFMGLVQAGEVKSVTVDTGSAKITGELKDGTQFVTHGGGDRGLSEADEALLREKG